MEHKDYLELVERVESLKKVVEQAIELLAPVDEPYRSDQVNELFAALAKAQSQFPPITKNKVNPWFDSPYSDIFEINRKIYPVLGAHGLAIVQQSRISEDGATILYTMLCHSSGQWVESRNRVIPPKNDIDSYRSILNALRISALLSLLGIGIQGDPLDDDGEIAMIEARQGLAKGPSKKDVESKKQESQTITPEQREELEREMKDHTDLAEEIMNRCHVRSLSDIPKNKYRDAIVFIRKNVAAREGRSV